jgi:hypothetical protein
MTKSVKFNRVSHTNFDVFKKEEKKRNVAKWEVALGCGSRTINEIKDQAWMIIFGLIQSIGNNK